MADEPEAELFESDEGGPVKSFLEHLEDLRWVLIKIGITVAVSMLVCLLAGNYLVRVLEWPLARAPIPHTAGSQVVKLAFGTNQIGSLQISTNAPFASLVGTNQFVRLEMTPVIVGTNALIGVTVHNEDAAAQKLPIQIINLSPAGAFVVATKVAFYGGLVISAPVSHF
jgi:Sec-independent protein secretion pathway component TatC